MPPVSFNINGIDQLKFDFNGTTTAVLTAPGEITVTNNLGSGGYTLVENFYGTAKIYDDGTIEQYGQTPVPISTGQPLQTWFVQFPVAFTSTPTSVLCGPNGYPDPPDHDPFGAYPTDISAVSFTAVAYCPVLIGGSGAGNINNPNIKIQWRASGR